jgi:hypothetical protein
MFLDYFDAWMLKMIFFLKNIILIHLQVKNILKNNCNHTSKHVIIYHCRFPELLLYFTISIIIQPLLYFSGNAWYLKPIRHGLFRFSKKKQQYHIISWHLFNLLLVEILSHKKISCARNKKRSLKMKFIGTTE